MSIQIGIVGIVAVFILMFAGMPIGFSFALIGGFGICFLAGWDAGLSVLGRVPYIWASDYIFSCVPLFIFMGFLIANSGLAKDLYSMANKWVGRLPGGLAIATILSCGAFAAVSGSSAAGSAAMGTICYPEMRRYGYDPGLASGCIAMGGTIAVMIPPSLAFIIYGIFSEASIGVLFIAGIIPGILELFLFSFTVYFLVRRNPSLAPLSRDVYTLKEKIFSLSNIAPILILFLFVLGGIYAGAFTPIEAGGVGATGALIICSIMKRLSWSVFLKTLISSAYTTAMFYVLVMGAMIFNNFVALSGIAGAFSSWIANLNLSPMAFLVLVLIIYLPLGALMDELAMIVLTLPIYLPTIRALDIDLIWFGVLLVLSCEIGMVAPPVGLNVFITQGVTKEPTLQMVYKGVMPFIAAAILLMAILVALPELSLSLPRLMK
jgi:tripartite ATP-independent transporter DctM subunit